MEAWWQAVREPVDPIGVTELLDALWWLPGPESPWDTQEAEAAPGGPIQVDGLDSAGWVGLGLSPRQAASAMRYRKAIGGFRNAAALQKMRVLPDGWMEHHENRLVFPDGLSEVVGEQDRVAREEQENVGLDRATPEGEVGRPVEPVDLNSVDSLTLLHVHGVGPWVAGKILEARRQWGGFSDTSLLVEALGWDSLARAIMPRFKCDPAAVHRRCPDSLSAEEWGELPGIGRREAASLVRFVGHHGGSEEALRSCLILDSARLNRALPYLGCGGEEHP